MDPELQVMAADVSNAFLYGKNIERTMIKAGPEFGELQGQFLIVEGGWYGHKRAAATFHSHFATKLRKKGFVPTKADLDLWIRRTNDGTNDGFRTGRSSEYVWRQSVSDFEHNNPFFPTQEEDSCLCLPPDSRNDNLQGYPIYALPIGLDVADALTKPLNGVV